MVFNATFNNILVIS